MQPRAYQLVGPLGVEREAEVRADGRADAARARLLDHGVDVARQQGLPPVVELDLEQVVAELVEQAVPEIQRHVPPGAADVADAGVAAGAREVADVRRLQRELHRVGAEARAATPVLPARAIEVREPLRREPGLPRRQLQELAQRLDGGGHAARAGLAARPARGKPGCMR